MTADPAPSRPNRRLARLGKTLGNGLLGLVVLAAFAAALQFAATQYVAHQGPLTADRLKAMNDARTSLVQLLVAAGVFTGLIYTARTYRLTQHTNLAARFTTAVGQVGDKDSESVRAGGVHGLALVAGSSDGYWSPVEQVLCALVRERKVSLNGIVGADIQAAMRTIARRERPVQELPPLDLRLGDLTGANLTAANLQYANLDGATLNGADLTDARLVGATLVGAELDNAVLRGTDFTEADLRGASLRRSNLFEAVLTSADWTDCDLHQATNLTAEQIASATGTPRAMP